jgi:ribonuclease P protein component
MLPAAHRMRRRNDFTVTVRRGRRAGGEHVVLHVLTPERASAADPAAVSAPHGATSPVLVGFVVNKAVGPSVTRKLVTRRLRHLMAERLDRCPRGTRIVVRALPTSSTATYAALGDALDRGLDRAMRDLRTAS